MAKLAVDPELTRVLGGMAASSAVGEVGYGESIVHPQIISVTSSSASLIDCQDTSMHGRMKQNSGQKVTVGRKNDLAHVTMARGTDGIWRIATINYAPASSCTAGA